MLAELSGVQEEYRSLLRGLASTEGPNYEEALRMASLGLTDKSGADVDEDTMIAVAMVFREMRHEEREPELYDLEWAQEFIDHLDTLGRKVVVK